ncbi:heparinase II/III family protein [Rhizobium sp. T1470]|uniref:heparinase II/III family protein n=1 Tax=unclassified Rhizobium TaxID=2613769 RepID=UPI001AAFD22F|nr:heparinase II/III family protein [Rhizobium sp. T1473]MCA0803837.1 heparinase II/III family protein [Rhizobium sp. T1473]
MWSGFSTLYVGEAWRRTLCRGAILRLRLFRHTIHAPERLIVAPTDLRAVDPHVAEEILNGRFPLAGRLLETGGKSPFNFSLPSRSFALRLHSFGWLRHMRTKKSDLHSSVARSIVNNWLSLHGGRIEGIAWEIDVTAQRVIAWLSHSPVVLHNADRGFYRRFLRSLAFQVRFLRRIAKYAPPGEVRFRLRIALAMASIAMPTRAGALRRAAEALDHEFDSQILPDGGHVSRNPRTGLELLLDLLPLRQTYVNLGHDLPQKLISGIDRMYPALRFFRHQDGDLALFNGATSTLATELMSLLRYDETAGDPFKAMPHSRYQRLAAGRTVVIADTGLPPAGNLSRTAHVGCLSFEMSSGRHRFIVNSGSPKFAGRRYVQIARTTAAHSTVTVNDTSSSRFAPSDFIANVITDGVKTVSVDRALADDGRDVIKASHDGYLNAFGVLHERELTLNATGLIVTGCDRLVAPEGKVDDAVRAVARFHAHPSINLKPLDKESVMMTAPDGETWLFSSPGNEVLIGEDVFFADASGICGSDLMEIAFSYPDRPEIRWFLSRKS